jgi:hypothetical protein
VWRAPSRPRRVPGSFPRPARAGRHVSWCPGSILHVYAVACCYLKHPDSVGRTVEVLEGPLHNLADALDGKASVVELRRRTRLATDDSRRVRWRSGDPPVDWYRGPWLVNVTDVLAATAATSPDLVEAWVRSIRATLAMVAASGGELAGASTASRARRERFQRLLMQRARGG